MLVIKCPWCGPRAEIEFSYGGEGGIARPTQTENLTDEQAMDLLVNQAFQSEGEARLKVIRSKQSSVQLSTYFTGRMAHYRLHQQVQRELGDKFSLWRYHEAVLSNGSMRSPNDWWPRQLNSGISRMPLRRAAAASACADFCVIKFFCRSSGCD